MIRLRDSEWERIRDHFPEENIPDGHPGRKPIPTRQVLEAVLWILNTGAQWHMLPQCYPNYKNGASSFPGVVPQRGTAWGPDGVRRETGKE
jgi:transposase